MGRVVCQCGELISAEIDLRGSLVVHSGLCSVGSIECSAQVIEQGF